MMSQKAVGRVATMVVAIGLAISVLPGASARNAQTAELPTAAVKTYKRRCTNYKCKKISEGTKPIFKCPYCGSSTVPHN